MELLQEADNTSYSSQDIAWYYESPNTQTNLGKDFGMPSITRNLSKNREKDNTKVDAGYPTKISKDVNVEWFDKDYSKYKLTIGSSSNPFLKKALELVDRTKELSKGLDKIPFIKRVKKEDIGTDVGFYMDIIPLEQEKENFEYAKSRFYYTEKTTKGGIDVGLKGEVKWTVWGLPYDKLPLPDAAIEKAKEYIVLEVYVVANASAGGELKWELKERKDVNKKAWKEHSKRIDPALLKLNMEFGVGAEASVLKENDYLSISGEAKGIAKAEIMSIGWQNSENFNVYFLREGAYIDIEITAQVTFLGEKLEATPYFKKIQLIE